MKILYSIQATGNGHIARANEVIPYFQKYGQVDVFLSGSNSSLISQIPVTYRSKGVSLFYGNSGALDYWQMAKSLAPLRILKEAKNLPVEKYDVVINDFESITSLACKIKKKPFIHFGHQASFTSTKSPRPRQRDISGELLLRYYANSEHRIGLHFRQYDSGIFTPILKEKILKTDQVNKGHVTVYLSHYKDSLVAEALQKVKDVTFHLFSKNATVLVRDKNVIIMPIEESSFNKSMAESFGVITGAGFETPAEALFMNKKLMCLPIKGQYEQACNAAALEAFGVNIVQGIDETFPSIISTWLHDAAPEKLVIEISTRDIVSSVIEKSLAIKYNDSPVLDKQIMQPDFSFF